MPFQKDLDLLIQNDKELASAIQGEINRQRSTIELIASENFTSRAVLAAQGSVLTNKYAEGYPGRRYYGGCEYVDMAETLAIERAKKLFNCAYANVQPHSGAQANEAVFLAFLKPGDTFLGMSLDAGGHLTHGSKVSMSGKWFNAIGYGVSKETGRIDYDQVASLAKQYKPKLIIAGGSSYARIIDFQKFRDVADEVGAILMVDMAHFAGLVAGGAYPSPLPFADVVTTTTHKTLRGPRGGMILANDLDMGKKIDSAVFPGLQGGPLMHVIAAKAVAYSEALDPSFKDYAHQIVKNAKAMSEKLMSFGINMISGGTDSHLFLVDLTSLDITGKAAQISLEHAGITCNKNAIPSDPLGPQISSGIRIGTPAITTRGFKEKECEKVAMLIYTVLDGLRKNGEDGNQSVEQMVLKEVHQLCQEFPLY
jgi:glycine hydroxymethyltransferase